MEIYETKNIHKKEGSIRKEIFFPKKKLLQENKHKRQNNICNNTCL